MNTVKPISSLQLQNNSEQRKYLKLALIATVGIVVLGLIVIFILFLTLSRSPSVIETDPTLPPEISYPISPIISYPDQVSNSRIIDGRYIDDKYKFSFKIPKGYEQTFGIDAGNLLDIMKTEDGVGKDIISISYYENKDGLALDELISLQEKEWNDTCKDLKSGSGQTCDIKITTSNDTTEDGVAVLISDGWKGLTVYQPSKYISIKNPNSNIIISFSSDAPTNILQEIYKSVKFY